MIYDFRKGKSALYFSSLLAIDYEYDIQDYVVSNTKLEHDHIGYFQKCKRNGFVRLGHFLPDYHDVKFGRSPALHVFDCSTTDELGKKMKVTNSAKNKFWSIDKNKAVQSNLEICKKCAKRLRSEFRISMGNKTFNDFILSLEESNRTKQIVVDGNGYIINWKQVSFCYRDSRNFVCEKCGFKASSEAEYKFLHTHHINGIKTDNSRENLQCLCVKCHSNVDEYHREKFQIEGLQTLLEFEKYFDKTK